MFKSIFLDTFKRIEELGNKPSLVGDRLIVELLPAQEIKRGSIIIQSDSKQVGGADAFKPVLALVLWKGEGYVDSEGNDVPVKYNPGEVVMLSQLGLKYYSTFPGLDYTENKLALTRQSEVHASWESIEELEKMIAAFSSTKQSN